MTHFIRQQYLHAVLQGSESDGFALQNQLTEICHSRLIPTIGEILDQYAPVNTHLVIDRLDIDAGTIEYPRLSDDLAPAVAKALKKAIEKAAIQAIENQMVKVSADSYILNSQENILDVFIYFLSKGFLPWSYKLPAGKDLEQVVHDVILSDYQETVSQKYLQKLMVVLKSPLASRRLTLQLSEQFILLLIRKVTQKSDPVVSELIESVDFKINKSLSPEISGLLKKLILEKSVMQLAGHNRIPKIDVMLEVVDELEARPALQRIISEIFEPVLSGAGIKIRDGGSKKIHLKGEGTLNLKIEPIRDRLEENTSDLFTRGIFIENAGLVLLHPFLIYLFGELGIAKNDQL